MVFQRFPTVSVVATQSQRSDGLQSCSPVSPIDGPRSIPSPIVIRSGSPIFFSPLNLHILSFSYLHRPTPTMEDLETYQTPLARSDPHFLCRKDGGM